MGKPTRFYEEFQVLSSRHRKSPGYGFGTSAKQGDIEIRAPGPGTYPRASAGSETGLVIYH